MTIPLPSTELKENDPTNLLHHKVCERCKKNKLYKGFNRAFGCCGECVTVADYDAIQPEISRLLRGFSPLEKQNILRECFYRERYRKLNKIKPEEFNGQANKEDHRESGQGIETP